VPTFYSCLITVRAVN